MIRVLSIEDHEMFCDGLRSRFRGDRCGISIICVPTLDKAYTINSDTFDIILLDLLIPGTNPTQNIIQLKNVFPEKPVIILTGEEREFWELEMLRAGVQAFFTKNDDRSLLKSAIIAIFEGVDLGKKRLAELEAKSTIDVHDLWENETDARDREIIRLYSKGNSVEGISVIQYMTPSAVRKLLGRMRKKFNANNNAMLIHLLRKKL